MNRIKSIDIVRGIVMIIMALDHVRDLMHIDSITQNPTDLTTTTPMLFFTRWITHLCAPIFVFLAGTSAYLYLKKNANVAESRQHLLKRGAWLLILEFTIVNFAIFFDIGFHTILFEVIASTGLGFILLALLIKTSLKRIGILGLAIIFLHNLTPLVDSSLLKSLLTPFFSPAAIPLAHGKVFVIGYPPIPWFGIMLAGFASGYFFELNEAKRKNLFLIIGITSFFLFIAIRLANVYGDSTPWSSQQDAVLTFLSFMNVTKYPPSLAFCLITLSIMFFLLAWAEQFNETFVRTVTIYGGVSLFYFVVHFYLIHLVTLGMLLVQGFDWSQLEFATGTFGRPKQLESGLPLWGVYLTWMFLVVTMYLPCRWFGRYKKMSSHWWIKYS